MSKRGAFATKCDHWRMWGRRARDFLSCAKEAEEVLGWLASKDEEDRPEKADIVI
jgi:hypothetical protein